MEYVEDLLISGIYCLYYDNTDNRYYIGYASNLKNRYSKHCSMLRNHKHHNYKLQEIYNKTNILPEFYILELCSINNLQNKEIFWINQFNSFEEGYNLSKGGEGLGFGELHPNALYDNNTYTNIFMELVYTNKTAKQISNIFNVNIDIVQDISCGNGHIYLKDKFPNEYSVLINKIGNRISGKSSAKDRGIIYPKICKNGLVKEVENTRQFARDNGLNQAALHRLLTYKVKSHKGWKIND